MYFVLCHFLNENLKKSEEMRQLYSVRIQIYHDARSRDLLQNIHLTYIVRSRDPWWYVNMTHMTDFKGQVKLNIKAAFQRGFDTFE